VVAMIRVFLSLFFAYFLVLLQLSIVMQWNHFTTIRFDHPLGMVTIYALNFFLVYSILSQVMPWVEMKLEQVESMKKEEDKREEDKEKEES
jgi:hypothetical protein